MRVDLSNVTLLCLENRDPEQSIALLSDMYAKMKFGAVHWLNTHKTLKEFQRGEFEIGKIDIPTSHALLVHSDAFVVNPELWDPQWLQYDYIGAPWPKGYLPQFNAKWIHRVGNSGFSLRSKRLMSRAVGLDKYGVFDITICQTVRAQLEREGFKFAPIDEAAKFSTELICPETPSRSFGFHGYWPESAGPAPEYYRPGTCASSNASATASRVILLTADGPDNSRTRFARETFNSAEVHSVNVLHRNASDIGDTRGCFYVKDVLDYSLQMSGDVFVYVNNDCALVPEWRDIVLPQVRKYGCAFSQRWDVPKFDKRLRLDEINGSDKVPFIGTDLFAFTPQWWKDRRNEFPDVVLGLEAWDAVLTWYMCKSGFLRGPTVIYHEAHKNFWSQKDVLQNHAAQKVVRERVTEWAKKKGLENMIGAQDGFLVKREMFCFDK